MAAAGFAIAKGVAVPCELQRRNGQAMACGSSQARPRELVGEGTATLWLALEKIGQLCDIHSNLSRLIAGEQLGGRIVGHIASLVQSLIWTDAGLLGAAGAGAISAGLSFGNGLADDEARRCGLTAVSTVWLDKVAIADGGTSGMSAGGLGMSSSDALGVGSAGLTSLMAPRRR